MDDDQLGGGESDTDQSSSGQEDGKIKVIHTNLN